MWLIREEGTLTTLNRRLARRCVTIGQSCLRSRLTITRPQRLTSMAKSIDWAVNVDKLRVCYNMPENLYDYLRNQDTRRDELTDARILDEETFSLVFTEEDEVKMTAVLNVRDVEGYYRLGTFTFSNSAKYAGKAFFSFENSALYRVYLRFPNA